MADSEIARLLDSLADRFCARRALYCLLRFLPAYFAPNGLTDGWEECRTALADTRALCKDRMTPDEAEDVHKAIVLIDRMLSER
jgi:hypothetical protein